MDPLTMGLIAGGASLVGNIFSSETSAANNAANIQAQAQMQEQTEQFNASQSEINREFQAQQVNQAEAYNQQMSNTAYQRASSDMKAAGLNPAMMFGSGGPASVPSSPSASGSSASVGTPNMALRTASSPLAGIGDAVAKVFSTAQDVQRITQQQADIDVARAQKHNIDASTMQKEIDNEIRGGTEAQTMKDTNEIVAARRAQEDLKGNTARNITEGMNPTVKKALDIGSYSANKISDVAAPIINSAGAARRFLPSRSTLQRSTVDSSGRSSDTFEDRWDNVIGGFQR